MPKSPLTRRRRRPVINRSSCALMERTIFSSIRFFASWVQRFLMARQSAERPDCVGSINADAKTHCACRCMLDCLLVVHGNPFESVVGVIVSAFIGAIVIVGSYRFTSQNGLAHR